MAGPVGARPRSALGASLLVVAIAFLPACSSTSADAPAQGSGAVALDSGGKAPGESASLEQAVNATRSSEGSSFTSEMIVAEEGKGSWRTICQGRISWQPTENAQWTCRSDEATAQSQIDSGIASGTVSDVVASSTTEVRVVDSVLYQTFGSAGADLDQADLSGGGDLCALVAMGYCSGPGNLLYQLQATGFEPTGGLHGSVTSTQGSSDVTATYDLEVDSRGRITTVTATTVITPSGKTPATFTTKMNFDAYGPQERTQAPA